MRKIKSILISPSLSIKQALKRMDEAGKKILFVVDRKRNILGVVSDGDVRKWILKNHSLDKSVSLVMNPTPRLLKEGFLKDEAKQIMLSQGIDCIPIVDGGNKVISAIWWPDIFDINFKMHKSLNLPVVIMAGGEGARLSPFTSILPKPLLPVGEKPIIELIMDRFTEQGSNDFYISVNYKANILKAYFSDNEHAYNIKYISEGKPLGTIGSLHLLKNKFKKTFFVSNCDILIDANYSDILKFHKERNNSITLVVSMKHYKIPYGICDIEKDGYLKGIREKPEYDFLVNTGMYVLDPSVLNDIPRNKYYDIIDLISDYIKKNNKIGVYPVSDKSWLDVGQWHELQNTVERFGHKLAI